MFYKIIEKKRDEWLSSQSCVITELTSHIETQIESITAFCFIKIKHGNPTNNYGRNTSDLWGHATHSGGHLLSMKIRNICGDEATITLK